MIKLYTVVPCYNEEEVLNETAKRLSEKYDSLINCGLISDLSRIVFVNDGSKDNTWSIILKLYNENPYIQGINLSRNRGHQNALLAGLMEVKNDADCVISMDADLQDDINAIDEMLKKYNDGCDIVYGVRASRKTDTAFKKFTAQGFYKLTNKMGGELVYNHADYRLMSRRALEALSDFKEVNLFLRGIVPMLGFKSDKVFYDRGERFAGKSKYPLKKMLSFAMEGITSLSIRPIEAIYKLGFLVCVVGGGVLIYALVRHLTGNTEAGWTSLMGSLWLLGGLQLLAIGIVGKYIGKMYLETKARPRYIISEYLKK